MSNWNSTRHYCAINLDNTPHRQRPFSSTRKGSACLMSIAGNAKLCEVGTLDPIFAFSNGQLAAIYQITDLGPKTLVAPPTEASPNRVAPDWVCTVGVKVTHVDSEDLRSRPEGLDATTAYLLNFARQHLVSHAIEYLDQFDIPPAAAWTLPVELGDELFEAFQLAPIDYGVEA